jgi:AraC family transcriptional regulator of adaptative response/methylated-DNA-[protein]-cysteine methyltransferase
VARATPAEALEQGKPVTRAALAAGFPDSSSYYRQADAALGMTASQFRRGGAATVVTWTTGDCALGRCLVAQSERGVCAVLPGDNDAALLDDLRQRFPTPSCVRATLSFVADGRDFRPPRRQPAAGIAAAGSAGTAFQLQVWQALRQIPAGRPAATARWQSILASRGR